MHWCGLQAGRHPGPARCPARSSRPCACFASPADYSPASHAQLAGKARASCPARCPQHQPGKPNFESPAQQTQAGKAHRHHAFPQARPQLRQLLQVRGQGRRLCNVLIHCGWREGSGRRGGVVQLGGGQCKQMGQEGASCSTKRLHSAAHRHKDVGTCCTRSASMHRAADPTLPLPT